MLDYSTKESLIVSAVMEEDDDIATDESTFFEIPLDDDMKGIEVSVLKWTAPPESPNLSLSNLRETDADLSEDDDHVYDDTVNLLQTSEALRNLVGSRNSSNSINGLGNASSQSSTVIVVERTPPLPEKPKWLSQNPPLEDDAGSPAPKYSSISPSLSATGSIGRRMAPIPQVSEEEDPG